MGHATATVRARTTIDILLADVRRALRRLEPHEAHRACAAGALLIDIRSELQRGRDGVVPGALFFPRNVLEWRCDPASRWRDPRVRDLDTPLIVMCDEGYQSSLAAESLTRLGFVHVTDLIGGFRAWRAADLPVQSMPEGGAMRAIECPCGHRLEGADDEELFRLCREDVDRDHPEMERTDAQIRERVAADAYDTQTVA